MAIRERRGSVTGWVAPILVSLAWALSCASLPTLPSFFLWILVFFLAFVSCISMSDSEAAFVALLLSHSSWDLRLYLVFSVAFFLSFLLVCEEEASSVSVSVSLCLAAEPVFSSASRCCRLFFFVSGSRFLVCFGLFALWTVVSFAIEACGLSWAHGGPRKGSELLKQELLREKRVQRGRERERERERERDSKKKKICLSLDIN